MKDCVIFDLDGTLLDTLADLTASVNFAMAQLKLPAYTQREVKMMIGSGVSVLMKRALTLKNISLHGEALRLQREFYLLHGEENTRPYDGICKMLSLLKKRNFAIVVHTNKDENVARKLCLNHFGNLVDCVCGTVDDSKVKPDVTRLLSATDNLGCGKAVYCGDSDVDIMTARNACLPCISVTWGFRDRNFLQKNGAEFFADSPDEVVALAEKLTGRG